MAKQKRAEGVASTQPRLTERNEERNEELGERLIQHFVEEAWNKRNLAVIDEVFTSDAVAHDPAVPAVKDVESIKQFIAAYLTAFPDLQVMVDDLFTTEDRIATRWTARGTHKGEFLGLAPTEKSMAVTGLTIYRLADGKIAEYWANWDSPGLLQQLGTVRQEEPAKGA
ncbi:MAG TPA: ester cyclase [Candidatus Binatia bacterium]|jgi:steroid delta-isomerase-like uncharacterized protein|nr:ester cyclase [Candidatus Binatia bacterium]